MNNIEILDYSEKSFIVIGDTKEIKEQFKVNGSYLGRYNKFLKVKDITGEEIKEAGWVFSLKHKEFITQIVNEFLGKKTKIINEDLSNQIFASTLEDFIVDVEEEEEQKKLF